MPLILPTSPVGGLARGSRRDSYFHRSTLLSATVNSVEWVVASLHVPGPHDRGMVQTSFSVNAAGCAKSTSYYLRRDRTVIKSQIGFAQCGDDVNGTLCEVRTSIPASSIGGVYSISFVESNCGSRGYSSATGHIWLPALYIPRSRLNQASPVASPYTGADS